MYVFDERNHGHCITLPEHTVVPYNNVPKKDYPSNIPKERDYEKAGS